MRSIKGVAIALCVAAATAAHADVTIDTGGFEGYALGPVAGQFGWIDDSSPNQPPPTIYEDAFTISSGNNKVLKVDPASLSTNDWSGAYLPLGDLYAGGMHQIKVSFDQFRGTLNQSVFILEAPGPNRAESSFVGYEYGLDGLLYPTGSVADFGIPLTANVWEHVNLLIDFDKQDVSADVNGVVPFDPLDPTKKYNPQHFDLGIGNVKEFRGIGFRVYGTNLGTPNGPNYFDNLVISGPQPVPEPASLTLLAVGILPLLRRRKHS